MSILVTVLGIRMIILVVLRIMLTAINSRSKEAL